MSKCSKRQLLSIDGAMGEYAMPLFSDGGFPLLNRFIFSETVP